MTPAFVAALREAERRERLLRRLRPTTHHDPEYLDRWAPIYSHVSNRFISWSDVLKR